MNVTEIIEVEKTTVSCDGGSLGHPRVFLHMKGGERQVDCPYCSRRFILREGVSPSCGPLSLDPCFGTLKDLQAVGS